MASIMETARKTLPKEKLGPLLAAGKTNKEIGMAHGGLPHWAISELKKEYWPAGFSAEEFKQQGTKDLTNFKTFPAESADKPEKTAPAEESEIIAWAKPLRWGTLGSVLKIYEDRLSISSAAVKTLKPARYVKIGVLKDGGLVIAPTDNPEEGYKLAPKRSQIGGGALIRFLKNHGINTGKYPLKKNEKGWLVAFGDQTR